MCATTAFFVAARFTRDMFQNMRHFPKITSLRELDIASIDITKVCLTSQCFQTAHILAKKIFTNLATNCTCTPATSKCLHGTLLKIYKLYSVV